MPTAWLHNINADTAAAAASPSLGAEKLMLTDIDGLYTRWPDRDSALVSGSTPAHWRSYCRR